MSERSFTEDWLSAYLDNQLSDENRKCVEQQLASNPECRKTLDDLQSVQSLVQTLKANPASGESNLQALIASVNERIDASQDSAIVSGDPRARLARWPHSPGKLAVMAVAASLMLAIGGYFALPKRPTPALPSIAKAEQIASEQVDEAASAASKAGAEPSDDASITIAQSVQPDINLKAAPARAPLAGSPQPAQPAQSPQLSQHDQLRMPMPNSKAAPAEALRPEALDDPQSVPMPAPADATRFGRAGQASAMRGLGAMPQAIAQHDSPPGGSGGALDGFSEPDWGSDYVYALPQTKGMNSIANSHPPDGIPSAQSLSPAEKQQPEGDKLEGLQVEPRPGEALPQKQLAASAESSHTASPKSPDSLRLAEHSGVLHIKVPQRESSGVPKRLDQLLLQMGFRQQAVKVADSEKSTAAENPPSGSGAKSATRPVRIVLRGSATQLRAAASKLLAEPTWAAKYIAKDGVQVARPDLSQGELRIILSE